MRKKKLPYWYRYIRYHVRLIFDLFFPHVPGEKGSDWFN